MNIFKFNDVDDILNTILNSQNTILHSQKILDETFDEEMKNDIKIITSNRYAIVEDEKFINVYIDYCGCDKSELTISFIENSINIKSDSNMKFDNKNVIYNSLFNSSTECDIICNDSTLDINKTTATMNGGLLILTIPYKVKETSIPKTIKIN